MEKDCLDDIILKDVRAYNRLSNEEKSIVIAKLYLNGRTMEQIADVIGISKATVCRYLKKISKNYELNNLYNEQIRLAKNHNKTANAGNYQKGDYDVKEVLNLYLNGKTMEQIANILDISTSTVSRIIEQVVNAGSTYSSDVEGIRDNNKRNRSNL